MAAAVLGYLGRPSVQVDTLLRRLYLKYGARAGPDVIEELNAALVAKLAQGKLLRGRKLRVDTTVVEADDIDYPTDADLLAHASASSVGWSAGPRPAMLRAGLGPESGVGRWPADGGSCPHATPAYRGWQWLRGSAHRRNRSVRQQSVQQVQAIARSAGRWPAHLAMGGLGGCWVI
jgi:hypothetical protein